MWTKDEMKHALKYAEFEVSLMRQLKKPTQEGYARSLGKQGSGEKVWTRSAWALRCRRNWEIGLSSRITQPQAAAVVRREVKENNAANGKTVSVRGNARGSQEIMIISIAN